MTAHHPDPNQPVTRRSTLAERFRAAGIPLPPPLSAEQRAELDERLGRVAAETQRFWAGTTNAA